MDAGFPVWADSGEGVGIPFVSAAFVGANLFAIEEPASQDRSRCLLGQRVPHIKRKVFFLFNTSKCRAQIVPRHVANQLQRRRTPPESLTYTARDETVPCSVFLFAADPACRFMGRNCYLLLNTVSVMRSALFSSERGLS